MINGVLVERTVKDVLPALQTNSDGLGKVLEELVKQYKRQQEDMEKWKVGFNLACVAKPATVHCDKLLLFLGIMSLRYTDHPNLAEEEQRPSRTAVICKIFSLP